MKNDTTIKSQLGLSQEEMAMLLGITRSQWALFNTGKRDIPLNAKQQLATIFTNLQKKKSFAPLSAKYSQTEKKKTQQWLDQEYKTVKHKQLYLLRKIKTVENIRKECFAALEVVHQLEGQKDNERLVNLAQIIKKRVLKTLEKNSLQHLNELELKKETLEMSKLKIEEKIKL